MDGGGAKEARTASVDEQNAGQETGAVDYRRTEENSTESAVTERTRESEFSTEANSKQEDTNTIRHVPGGMWLLQGRGYQKVSRCTPRQFDPLITDVAAVLSTY
ncbi:hypothetical protein NDU88_001343 [Pleurodeles waltl]|uniref:Uncharacterized protein n=1 Tax=Pleurodeles waltl TaxID=8319 RepID=A0AAV7M0U2_PLEWA|nr:hypothetical protein NDU88_001343 [Pleurodeles waltl]